MPVDGTHVRIAERASRSTPWTRINTLGFAGAWVDYAAPYGPAYYRKVGDIVYLRGLISTGAVGAICTLPVGFRPQYEPIVVVACFQGSAEIRISTAGVVSLASVTPVGANGTTWTTLTGVTFSTI